MRPGRRCRTKRRSWPSHGRCGARPMRCGAPWPTWTARSTPPLNATKPVVASATDGSSERVGTGSLERREHADDVQGMGRHRGEDAAEPEAEPHEQDGSGGGPEDLTGMEAVTR